MLCIAPAAAQADEFFLVRDENPLVRAFYVPLPSDSRLSDAQNFSATLAVSNTLNAETRGNESLFIDGESDALRLTYDSALVDTWRYRFTLPIIHDSGGFLDAAIDHYHRWFGFSPGLRPNYPRYQLAYAYSGHGSINVSRSQTSLGDIAGELGWFALDDAHRTVSLWGGLEAPSGSVSKLTGDGAWDGALWAHGALRWPNWQLAAELGVSEPFGDEMYSGAAHRASVFGRFATSRALGSSWSLRAQLDGQTSRLEDTGLRMLGPSLQLSVGAVRRLRERWLLEFGFAEDVAVNTAPDITFFFEIRRQSGAK